LFGASAQRSSTARAPRRSWAFYSCCLVPAFEVVGLMPILAGALLAMCGWKAVRALWFPILFIAFMVPLPGIVVDALTGPLKQQVSVIAEQTLHLAGYPVARSGVVITIGPYQLLVADACAGLHSMFSLSALGLLFIYLTRRPSVLHNAVMLAAILPIAFLANLVRVLLLMLITFHLGDEAGQGFLHGATGILLLVVALAGLMGLDAVLARVTAHPPRG
jgi:exosortase B